MLVEPQNPTFEAWYDSQYQSVLAAAALFCTGDHARAEDAANDACVKAYEDWDRVSQMDSPTAWATRVALNNAKRSYRRGKRRIQLLNRERLSAACTDTQRDLDLFDALGQLSRRQRAALILRYVEDLPQAMVADRMDVALGTATATLTQARSRLRAGLAEERSEENQ